MVIEARQRSPLGVCYRTPLDVFGSGAEAPIEFDWRVERSTAFEAQGGIDLQCQEGAMLELGSFVEIEALSSADWIELIWQNETIGFTNLTNYAQVVWTGVDCPDVIAGTNDRSRLPGGAGTYKPYMQLSQNQAPDPYSFGHFIDLEPATGRRDWQQGDGIRVSLGFVPPAPKQVLTGTVSNSPYPPQIWQVDYSDCSIVFGTGTSQTLRFDIDIGRLRSDVTESDFLTWVIEGQSSAQTMTVGEYAATHICGAFGAFGERSRYYQGQRSNVSGTLWTHEYLTSIQFGISETVLVVADDTFSGTLPPFIPGESITVTEP